MNIGVVHTLLAHTLWGLFPFYFHALSAIGADEILAHRIVWSLVFVLGLLTVKRKWRWIVPAVTNRRTMLLFCASSLLVATNWGIYVYAIVSGRTLEASLGYFINPLVSVAIGALVLGESLRRVQREAIALAALAVAWITWSTHQMPILGLGLAISFGLYGLIRKIAPLASLEGFALESALLTPLALLYMGHLSHAGTFAFALSDTATQLWLLASGPITAIPLLLFASGVRRIPYSLAGILQYESPTLVFLIGIFCFHEPFSPALFLGFLGIWTAVSLFTIDSLRARKRSGQC